MERRLLKPHAPLFEALLRLSDPLITMLVGALGHAIYLANEPTAPIERYVLFSLVGAMSIVALFPLFRLYTPQRGVSMASEVRSLTLAWLVIAGITSGAIFATKMGDAFSRIWVALWLVGGFGATLAFRASMRIALRAARRRGLNLRHIVIVGAGQLGETIAARLRDVPWAGYDVVGFYDDDASKIGQTLAGRPILDTPERLVETVVDGQIDQVWIALPLRADRRIREILGMLRDTTVEVRFVPDIYGFHLLNHSVTEIAGLPIVSLTETPLVGSSRVAKRVEDLLLTLLFLIPGLPLMALIALGIRLSSPGPILYRQERVTWNGEAFTMLKFRSMPVNAEGGAGPVWSQEVETRATPFGALLRRLSLDELPQLFNVLRGEMSLVGPRPERPEFVEQFRRQIPGYMQKHLVKAGITGWAQIHDLRGSSDLARRIEYDLFYIENWSVWLDLRILALTALHVVASRNAR